jgi:hypothetical protein
LKRGLHARFLLAAGLAAALAGAMAAEEKPGEKKELPRVVLAIPPGVRPGVPARLILRGLRLDQATEVRVLAGMKAAFSVPVGKKGKAELPAPEKPEQLGDTQVEVELTLPADLPGPAVALSVVTPMGETRPHLLLLDTGLKLFEEKEPNDGFRTAQPIEPGWTVAGSIQKPQDVDVFAIEGRAGDALVFDLFAQRFGSALDPVLTLYDARGEEIESRDDLEKSTDSRLEIRLPVSGTYYLAVSDALDRGGPSFIYRLTCAAGRKAPLAAAAAPRSAPPSLSHAPMNG